MAAGGSRWVEVSPSQFTHEREGLDSVRSWLEPMGSPYRAWSNFEFRDSHGGWHEVDLLVLGPKQLYLVELKHYRGRLSGDDTRWRRNGGRVETSPLLLARRKAQRLATKLKDAAREWAVEKGVNAGEVTKIVPFVQEAVLLHHDTFVSLMTGSAAMGLYGLESKHAQERSNLPPLSELITEPGRAGHAIGPNAEEILATLMTRIGLVQRREREAGSWVIQEGVVDEGVSGRGDAWQDWRCNHIADSSRTGRLRVLLGSPGEGNDPQHRVEVARNEFRLSRKLRHEAILTPEDFVTADFGVGLVYPDDRAFQRLDLWLTERVAVSLETALSVVRQIAEGLRYAHEHGVAHRTLGAGAVWVRPRHAESDDVEVQIRDWSFAGNLTPATTGVTSLAARASYTDSGPADEDRWLSEAFRAPESQWNKSGRASLDVFSLGALAAYVVTGRPPALSALELRRQLGENQNGIDIVSLGASVPEEIRQLIRAATHPDVSKRTDSVSKVLDALDEFQRPPKTPESVAVHPLDAMPKAVLAGGRFTVKKRLGRGSTARGLLVGDTSANNAERVLKVALDEDKAAARLVAEAEVLRTLKKAKKPAKLIEGPLDVDGCTSLLLESAGWYTLAEELSPGQPVPLDFLQRWGTDLLDTVVELDQLGVDHRDIKPSNIGVRKNASTRKEHLVLFDFSLTRAAADEIEAGTPPYRDPFLGLGRRRRFDSAAERYSVAVVMFQMATGHTPQFGDGLSLPTLIEQEATIDLAEFPAALAADFADFFRTALRRDAAQRFDSAVAMRQAWAKIFSTDTTTLTPTDDDDRRAAAATLDTPLEQAGLTARGLSALAPFGVQTVRDFLIKVDAGHTWARVALVTRLHLQNRRSTWEKKFGLPRSVDDGALAAGVDVARRTLEQTCGPANATARRQFVRLLLGAEGHVDAFAPTAVVGQASSRHLGQAQADQMLDEALGAWATDAAAKGVLDAAGKAIVKRIGELGGAVTLREATDAVLDAASTPVRSPDAVRTAQGLLRLALERRRALRGGGTSMDPLVVRRRDGQVVLIGTSSDAIDALEAVGRAAEDLVLRSAGPDSNAIVPATTAARELLAALEPFTGLFPAPKAVAPDDSVTSPDENTGTGAHGDEPAGEEDSSPATDDAGTRDAKSVSRLIRAAEELAPHVAAASTLDLYHVDLSMEVALAETFRGYSSNEALTPEDVRSEVRNRFRTVPKLPNRPALDTLVERSGADLRWDEKRFGYVVPERSLSTTSLASMTVPARDASVAMRDLASAKLDESVETRSFLAVGVTGHELGSTVPLLAQQYDATVLDVTGLLIDAMQAAAAQHGAAWDVVVAADARPVGTGDRTNLEQLVALCLPEVWHAIDEAVASGDELHPVILTELGPLARYGHIGELTRWSDIALPRRRAVWALAPQVAGSEGPVIDGAPLPLGSPGQYVRLARGHSAALASPEPATDSDQIEQPEAPDQAPGNSARPGRVTPGGATKKGAKR